MINWHTTGYGELIIGTYIIAYGGPINGTSFGNWFHTKYLRLRLLHHPFALWELHIIALF